MNSLSPNSPIDNSSQTCIYGLADPENEEVFYVGQSVHPGKRYREHLNDHSPSRKTAKIEELAIKELVPKLLIIEWVVSNEADAHEIYWMNYYQEQGHTLTNVANNSKIVEWTRPIRPSSRGLLSTKFYRKTYYSSLQCDQDITAIRNRYGLSTESDAIRLAVHMLAGADNEIVLRKGRTKKETNQSQRRLF